MSRTRKWLTGIGAAIGVLVLAVVVLLAWLLYTPSGLHFALDRGAAMTHGRFAYASAQGSIAGGLAIDGLRYKTDTGDTVKVRHAAVDLKFWAILTHHVDVRRARIDGIKLDLGPSKAPAGKSSSFSLKPPLGFTVALHDVRLTDIAISKQGQPTFQASGLALGLLWSPRTLTITQLALRAPAGRVNLKGTLATAPGYAGHGRATIDWTRKGSHYAGTLTFKSDGHTARLEARFTAPAPINLNASVALNQAHAWTLSFKAPTFAATDLPALPAALHTLAVDIHGAGDSHGGKLKGKVVANGHTMLIDPAKFRYASKTLTLDPLRLASPAMPGVATATGKVHLGKTPMTMALDANWQGVQLPADLVGQKLATHGTMHLAGSADHMTLAGALAIGPPKKLADLQLHLVKTTQAIELNTLKLVQKHGGLDAHGRIRLKPHVSWKLDAVAKRFNPGAILAGWNGAMDFRLATTGKLASQGPDISLRLDHAGGTLRGKSIAGSKADLTITRHNFLDGSLTLVAGHSRIHAVGKSGDQTDARIALDIASLADWMPEASGALKGRFTARGQWPKLAVAGHLQGDHLRARGRHIDSLRLQASIPNLARPGGKLDLTLSGVAASGLDFASVKLIGSGDAASHHLKLDAKGKQLSATLTLAGSWEAKNKRWTGRLSGVQFTLAGMPTWRQQQVTTVTWHKGAMAISQLCLAAGQPQLCLAGSRQADGTFKARYSLQRLPLQLLAALASKTAPLQAQGEISGSGKIVGTGTGGFNGQASLAVSQGRIGLVSAPNQPLLAWSAITVNAAADGQNEHVTLQGKLANGGHLDGSIDVEGAARKLGGTIDVDLRSLAALSAFSPQITNVKGTVAGRLELAGTISAPRFTGRIQARGFGAELPRAGITLHDGNFAISGNPDGKLALTGQIASGKGVLHIDGSAGIGTNAPLTLNIKGDKVLVADMPAAHVLASPDLHMVRKNGALQLSGEVTIPSAKVALEKLPGQGPTQASPDVVVVDAPAPKKTTPLNLTANITVKFGDHIQLEGYGFKGNVHGQLAIAVAPGRPVLGRGQILVSGKYQAYGQDLTIDDGRVLFAGTRIDDPGLDLRAVRRFRQQDVTVGLNIRGTAQHPVLTVFSDPAMPQADALSYLVAGRPAGQLRNGQGDAVSAAAQALGGLAANRLGGAIGSRLGVQAGVSNSQALGGSAFTAGKYLSPRLFLSYGVGLFIPGQVITLRYTINRFLNFEAENATTGNRASLNYKIEKN
jgi:translocation and assembly module TamB